MKFEQPVGVSKEAARRELESGSVTRMSEALVSLALHEPDWVWVQEWCFRLSDHDAWEIRAISATCLGHLARIHRRLDLERALPILAHLQKDVRTAGYAETALDDIELSSPEQSTKNV